MRNARITKPELYEEAGCSVSFALFAKQSGLEVGDQFNIDVRRWEEDTPRSDGSMFAARFGLDWTDDLTFVQSGGPRGTTVPSDRNTGISAEKEMVALMVGTACAARKMKKSFFDVAKRSSSDRFSRCAQIAKSIYGDDGRNWNSEHVRLIVQARILARHKPFFETVMWFASLLYEDDVRDGWKSFEGIAKHYAKMGGRLPLPAYLLEKDRDERLNSIPPVFEET